MVDVSRFVKTHNGICIEANSIRTLAFFQQYFNFIQATDDLKINLKATSWAFPTNRNAIYFIYQRVIQCYDNLVDFPVVKVQFSKEFSYLHVVLKISYLMNSHYKLDRVIESFSVFELSKNSYFLNIFSDFQTFQRFLFPRFLLYRKKLI